MNLQVKSCGSAFFQLQFQEFKSDDSDFDDSYAAIVLVRTALPHGPQLSCSAVQPGKALARVLGFFLKSNKWAINESNV